MSEPWTPTTENVEDGYAHDPESEYRDPVNYGSTVQANRRAFRRWLAGHDKRVAEGAWDGCLDAIEENELNTEQARAGNPYRAEVK